ncbi:MAG: DUF3850 domain-containing protein [bacterium]|nr:DUF3850 domain-containing protein [bacterium]
MSLIKKKIWPEYFEAVAAGRKKFELRLGDIEAQVGDVLLLEEWNPETKSYTGRSVEKKITYIGRWKSGELERFWPKDEIEEKGIAILSLE